MGFDLDAVIVGAVDAMRTKHPVNRPAVGASFEQAVARVARDREVQDRLAIRGRRQLWYVETPQIVLPDMFDVQEFGRRPTQQEGGR